MQLYWIGLALYIYSPGKMATCRIQALMVSGHPMASAMNCCLTRGSISWWSSEEAKLVAGFMRFLGELVSTWSFCLIFLGLPSILREFME